MTLVVDSSITLAWLLPDENRAAADSVVDQVKEFGAWVPSIWHLEVANGLQQGVRRKRIDQAICGRLLSRLDVLSFSVDPDTSRHAWGRTRELAVRFALTLYDAAYLELADRRELPLATLDRDLRRATAALGIPLLGAD